MLKKAAYHTLALRTSFMLFAFTLIAFQVSAQSSNDGEAETDTAHEKPGDTHVTFGGSLEHRIKAVIKRL